MGASYTPEGTLREEGRYVDGELDGYGTTYVNGEKFYEGFFEKGEWNGFGTLYSFGQKAYEGVFLNGKRHGYGTQWWPLDNSMYTGDFNEDKRTGKGELYINNVKRYEGDFVDGKFHGNGTLYNESGNKIYSGEFIDGSFPYESAPMKGNKWVSVTFEKGRTVAESYKLTFNLPPHSDNLKENLELSVRCIDDPSTRVSALGIYAHFTSKGKNAFILGGYPAELRYGTLTVRFNGQDDIILKPVDVSNEMNPDDTSIDEVVAYDMDKDTMKRICDGSDISMTLTGMSDREWTLTGPEIKYLMRASWNGIFNGNDYTSYLQQSPSSPKIKTGQSQGCYVATAVYGSYDCPEVWTLRRFRDTVLARTMIGRVFIKFYYAVSPWLVSRFGDAKVFNSLFKRVLDKLVTGLNDCGVDDSPYVDKQ